MDRRELITPISKAREGANCECFDSGQRKLESVDLLNHKFHGRFRSRKEWVVQYVHLTTSAFSTSNFKADIDVIGQNLLELTHDFRRERFNHAGHTFRASKYKW